MRAAYSLVISFLLSPVALAETVLYVDDSAMGTDDGSSWCDAFVLLQDALTAAEASGGTITEIRVAQGTYKPDQGTNQTPGDRTASFNLVDGVAIRGGFAGCGASNPDEQDNAIFPTTLSGDLLGDDGSGMGTCCFPSAAAGCGDPVCEASVCNAAPNCCVSWNADCAIFASNLCSQCGGRGENSHHIVVISSGSSILSGLIFVSGNADASSADPTGGALIVGNGGELLCSDCRFQSSSAANGGAIVNRGVIRIASSIFVRNNAFFGGAILNQGELFLRSTLFIENWNFGGASRGGAIVSNGTYFEAIETSFLHCRNENVGGALNIAGQSRIAGCQFVGNQSALGGAVFAGGDTSIVDSLVVGNQSSLDSGGLALSSGSARVEQCAIIGNIAGSRGGGIRTESASTIIANSILWTNADSNGASESAQFTSEGGSWAINYVAVQGWTGALGGVGNIGDDPLFVGGPSGVWTAEPIYDFNEGKTTAIDASASWQPNEWIGKLLNPNTSQYLQSYIVGNTATTITVLGDFSSLGVTGATYKINDYRLSSGSPCIDAADNTAVPADELDLDEDGDTTEPTPFDLDGNPRFKDDPTTPDTGVGTPPIVDMGAHEYQRGCLANPDCDNLNPCDGVETCVNNVCEPGTPITCDDAQPCNGAEVCNISGDCDTVFDADCNNNSTEDECDIIGGSPDVNGNGIPDECEPGACCAPDGSCTESAQANCAFAWSVGHDCAPNPCAFLTAVEVLGCRYFSVTPNPSADPDLSLAIRVERQDLTCPVKYVVLDSGMGRLVDFPAYVSAEQWGTVVVADRETVPLATFTIQTQTDDGLSESVSFTLRKWGDVVSPFGGPAQPNFGDISAIVDCFRGAPGSAPIGACDLQPIVPDAVADFADISKGVDAFRGLPYPFTVAGQCP